MDGQVELSLAERSRLLAGNRPPVSLSSLGAAFQEGHGLSRPPQGLPDLPPGVPPSTLTSLGPFPGRYLPSISMHSTASSLAVMGSYLGGAAHGEALKSLLPDSLSQCWAAHAEGYPRYVINNNLYPPYATPFLPSSDSLPLLPPGHSASQQHAAYHRLYDLNKDVYLGGMPHSLGQPGSLFGMAPSTPGLQPRPSSASALPSPLLLKQEALCEPLAQEKPHKAPERRGHGKGDGSARTSDKALKDSDKALKDSERARDLSKKCEWNGDVPVPSRGERLEVGKGGAVAGDRQRSPWGTLTSSGGSGKVDGEGATSGGGRGVSGSGHQDKPCRRSALKPQAPELQGAPFSPGTLPLPHEAPREGDRERRPPKAKGEARSRPQTPVGPGVLRTQAIPTLSTVTVTVSGAAAAPHPTSAFTGSTQSVYSCVQPVSSTTPAGSPLSVSASALGGQSSSALPYYHTLYSQPPGSAPPGVRKVQATTTFVPEVGTLGPASPDKSLVRLQETRVKSENTPRSSCCREKAPGGGGSAGGVGGLGGLLKVPSVMCSAASTSDSESGRTQGEVAAKASPGVRRKAGHLSDAAGGSGGKAAAEVTPPVSSVTPTRSLPSASQRPALASGGLSGTELASPSRPAPLSSPASLALSPGSRLCVRSGTGDADADPLRAKDVPASSQPLALALASGRKRDSGRSPSKAASSLAKTSTPAATAGRSQSKKAANAATSRASSRCDVIDVTSGEDDTPPESTSDDVRTKTSNSEPSSASSSSSPTKQGASVGGECKEGRAEGEKGVPVSASTTATEGKKSTQEEEAEPGKVKGKLGSRLCRRSALLAENAGEKRCGSAPPSAPACPNALSQPPPLVPSCSSREGASAQGDKPDPHLDRADDVPEHTGCNIPVGIAVARQRAEQPRGQDCTAGRGPGPDQLSRPSDNADSQRQFSQDFKDREDFLRQQKALLAGTAKSGVPPSLPPNLVVTGNVSGGEGALGGEDPRVRSLQGAGPWLPGGHSAQASSWLANPFLHPSIVTSTAPSLQDPAPFPFASPPGGFKIAQDPLTGQIYILPAAASEFVEQGGGLWSAFQTASHSQPGPPFPQLLAPHPVSPQDQDAPRTEAYPDGLASMADGTETEISVGEEGSGGEQGSQPTSPSHPASSPPSSSRDRSPQHSPSGSPNPGLQAEGARDKMAMAAPLLPTDVGLQGGGPYATYPYPAAQFPYVFSPGLLPMAGLPVSLAEPLTVKTEPPSVQSRGTSPMVLTPPPSDDTPTGGVVTEVARTPVAKCSASVQTCDLELQPPAPPPVALREQCCQTCQSPEAEVKEDSKEDVKPHREEEGGKTRGAAREGEGVYNPYTDPQILQAADGLELLSALAERRSMISDLATPAPGPPTPSVPSALASPSDSLRSEGATPAPERTAAAAFPSTLHAEASSTKVEPPATPKRDSTRNSHDSGSSPRWSFPRKSESGGSSSLSLGSLKLPGGFDTMGAMEVEMRMRLAELQRRYKEKQRELAKLQPKVKDKDSEDKAAAKRRPGRPRKRKFFKKSDDDSSTNGAAGKSGGKEGHQKKRRLAEELVDRVFRKLPPTKSDKRKDLSLVNTKHGSSLKRRGSSSSSRSTENSNHSDGPFGSSQGVFKSKKPQQHSTVTISKAKFKTTKRPADFKGSGDHDVGNLFSNIASSMLGTSEKKRRTKKGGKQEQSEAAKPASESKLGRAPHAVSPTVLESGLGLLAKFASSALQHGTCPSRALATTTATTVPSASSSPSSSSPTSSSPVIAGFGSFSSSGGSSTLVPRDPGVTGNTEPARDVSTSLPSSPPSGGQRSQRESDTDNSDNNGSSGNKKRKPGRPKKYTSNKTQGVTETIVAKKSKLLRISELTRRPVTVKRSSQKSEERRIQLDSQAPMTPLNLDEEWCLRRSERIFLSEPSLQPSSSSSSRNGPPPANASAAIKHSAGKQACPLQQSKEKFRPSSSKPQEERDRDRAKVQKAKSLQELTQKVKKKYSKTLSKKAGASNGEESSAKARQSSSPKWTPGASQTQSDSDGDDVPLSTFRQRPSTPEPRSCTITQEELRDNLRVLHFQNGLFYEGVIRAIQPPDVYGVLIDNERGNRPHIYSQEEILKNAIFDVRPGSQRYLGEGTRVCAYWSQQFSCLYPGTITKSSPNPHVSKNLVNVEFDDGDTGRILIEHIRLLPPDFPVVAPEPNALLHLTKRRRRTTSEDGDSRKSSDWFFETPSVSDDFGRFRRCSVSRTNSRAGSGGRRESVGSLADGDNDVFEQGGGGRVRKSSSADRAARPRGRPSDPKPPAQSKKGKKSEEKITTTTTPTSDPQPILRPAAFDPSKIRSKMKQEEDDDDDDDDDSSEEEEETSEEETSDSSEEEEEDDDDEEEDEKPGAESGTVKRKRSGKSRASPAGGKKARTDRPVSTESKGRNRGKGKVSALLPPHQLWRWSGSSTKRPGMKGKAKRVFYKAIVRGRETIAVGDSAVFMSAGRINCPYVGRIESMWQSWNGQMFVKVRWFYHPEETQGVRKLIDTKGALFESLHEDENDVQTISHRCELLTVGDFRRRRSEADKRGLDFMSGGDIYYLAGQYDPFNGLVKTYEPDVVL